MFFCVSQKLQINTSHSLQDISVKLQLAVAQELSNHLSTEALPLQQEVCYPYGRVRYETTRDQEVDAPLWVPDPAKNRNREIAVLDLALCCCCCFFFLVYMSVCVWVRQKMCCSLFGSKC